MTNKLKIKLTKEQISKCNDWMCANTLCLEPVEPKELIIEVEESQIVKEKSNVDKWRDIFVKFEIPLLLSDTLAVYHDEWGYNADAAYKEVMGES